MLDFCIVNSPLFRHRNPLYDEDSLPPIGLGYIATQVRLRGLSVKLIDAVADRIPLEELLTAVRELNPKALGINVFTTNFDLVRDIVERLSETVPHIIIGGLSTRTLHDEIFRWNSCSRMDVIFGDGELITPDLLNGTLKQEPTKQVGANRFYAVDDSSPYFNRDISGLPLDRRFFTNEPVVHPKGFVEANIVASRGCIYNCAFCAAARSLNRDISIRERSNQCLIAELTEIAAAYPTVTSIRVLDDLFLKTSHSIQAAIDVFGQFKFNWRSMAHVMTFNDVQLSTLYRLRESGCSELFVGVESGSPRILKSIHKTHDTERIVRNLTMVLEAGIGLKTYFIFGFPSEVEDDFAMTYSLASRLKEVAVAFEVPFRTSVFQFRPYHGTELYHSLIKVGAKPEDVLQAEGSPELSSLVGRLQFNFHSGNYSAAPIDIVRKYIYDTANLSTNADWGLK